MDVLTILAVSAMVAIPSWFAARNHKGISKLDKSISNGHTYPLRQDVDEIRSTLNEIRTDVHGVKSDIADIRNELRQERKDRIDLDDRFERYRKTS
jgi:septation ring formation regulator EzrA